MKAESRRFKLKKGGMIKAICFAIALLCICPTAVGNDSKKASTKNLVEDANPSESETENDVVNENEENVQTEVLNIAEDSIATETCACIREEENHEYLAVEPEELKLSCYGPFSHASQMRIESIRNARVLSLKAHQKYEENEPFSTIDETTVSTESDEFITEQISEETSITTIPYETQTTLETQIETVVETTVETVTYSAQELKEYVPGDIDYILENAILPVTYEEYVRLCCMTFHESGHCSWEMQNGCASACINQAIRQNNTINGILDTPNRFGNGIFKMRFYNDDGTYVVREVQLSDITDSVFDAVNQALLGYDVNYETIGGSYGFWAPNYCSDAINDYFYEHVRGTVMIENVCFYHDWV